MKHRNRKGKIKHKHHILKELEDFLEKDIAPLECVKSIIPGRIASSAGVKKRFLVRFQYDTESGGKLLAYSSGAVQEVFIVTDDPERLRKAMNGLAESEGKRIIKQGR